MYKIFESPKVYMHVLVLNFGPQHPAAHGVLRLILYVKGEVILTADPHIGLLHRGTEKLIESKNYIQALPYLDRLDYVSMMVYEHTYILLLEQILKIEIPLYISYIRVLFLELTRLLNHLLAVGCHAMDLGAFTPFLWGFEEREKILEFCERVCGARMHAAFFRVGGFSFNNIPDGLLDDILIFANQFIIRLNEMEELLTQNRIWKDRLINIGVLSHENALKWGASGVMLRGSGFAWDLRKQQPYEHYQDFDFAIPVGQNGDCYDRFIIRMQEMRQSIRIIIQIYNKLLELKGKQNTLTKRRTDKKNIKNSMEALINHFKNYTDPISLPKSELYIATEAPKGEFGIFFVSNGTATPYRCKFKAPGFNHLQMTNLLCQGHLIADVVTVIGTLDIVFGEIDR